MLFPVFIFKDKSSDFGVVVPGLPGCFSAGRTMEDALVNVREAIEMHLEGLVEDGLEMPEQKSIGAYKKELKAGGVAAIVDIDTSPYEKKQSERVNVTFPKALLRKIDKASEHLGTTRSGFLQKAAKSYIVKGDAQSGTWSVAGRALTKGPVSAARVKTSKQNKKTADKKSSSKTT